MARHVTHYSYYETEPNASDPDGDEALACGADYAYSASSNKASVTCKKCLKAIGVAAPTTTGEAG